MATFNTGDNLFGTSSFIVSSTAGLGNYTTIQDAIDAASSGNTVFIRDGDYAEDLALKSGVNLSTFGAVQSNNGKGNVNIQGKLSYSSAEVVSIYGINLETNGDYLLEVTGSATSTVYLLNCYLSIQDHTAVHFTTSNSAATVNLINCFGDITDTGISIWTMTSTGTLNVKSCIFNNSANSTTASTNSAGILFINYTLIKTPISVSGTGGIFGDHNRIDCGDINTTAITVTASGTCAMGHNIVFSGTASAASIGTGSNLVLSLTEISSSNTDAITGLGNLTSGGLIFNGSSSTINVTTQLTQPTGPVITLSDGPQIRYGTGSPNGVVTAPKGSFYMNLTGSGVADRAYINTDGSTAWTNFVTAA